jgi:hypothetical protein
MSFKRVGCLNHPAIQALDIAGSMDAFAAATPAGWCWAHARPLSTHQDRDGFADRACRVRPPDEAAIHARDGATPNPWRTSARLMMRPHGVRTAATRGRIIVH